MVIKVKIVRDKKGLSPIFASLIVLAVVTVLFIPVFFWSTGITTQSQNFWELSGLIASERITIEEANLKAGITTCTIYVRNLGKTSVIIDNVFISSSSALLYDYESSEFSTDLPSILQGDLVTISIANLAFTPVEGIVYTVQVYTSRGVGDSFQVKA